MTAATGSGVTPSHTYSAPGTYTVTLNVTDSDGGLTNETSHQVSVGNVAPIAAFTITTATHHSRDNPSPSTPPPQPTPTADPSPIIDWTFGDDRHRIRRHPLAYVFGTRHLHRHPQRHRLRRRPHQRDLPLSYVANVAPIAAFTITTPAPLAGQPVSFDASTSTDPDGGSITNYPWTFGDSTTGSGVTPQHTYAAPGTYTVTLNVTDSDGGLTNETSHQVTVTANVAPDRGLHRHHPRTTRRDNPSPSTPPPQPTPTAAQSPPTPGPSVTAAPAPGVTPSHTYSAPGTYTVTLNVTDSDGGLTNETSHSVTIANVAPIAAFTITTRSPTGTTTRLLRRLHLNRPRRRINNLPTPGPSETATQDQASPHTHTYAAPGTYTVTLNVTDSDGGLTNETSHSVTIANVPPIAAFTITTGSPTGTTARLLRRLHLNRSRRRINNLLRLDLRGRRRGSPASPPQHTYPAPGTYTVTLNVTDSDGGLTNDDLPPGLRRQRRPDRGLHPSPRLTHRHCSPSPSTPPPQPIPTAAQ